MVEHINHTFESTSVTAGAYCGTTSVVTVGKFQR